MNKGSSVELAVAVHAAGAYPSLCSWTYNRRPGAMRRDIEKFIDLTGSCHLHLSFELYELDDHDIQGMVADYNIPTIEIIYGQANTFNCTKSIVQLEADLLSLLDPIKARGTRVFRRIYETMSADLAQRHMLDGFCIKGLESAGFGSFTPVRDLFLQQQRLTPHMILIPYGGVGTAEQVKDYINLGAEMVAVGTLFALSQESTVKLQAKLAAIETSSKDLTEFAHSFQTDNGIVSRKQTALQFRPYQGPDDANGTMGLVQGIWKKHSDTGHVYLGHAVDHVTTLRTCHEIVADLTQQL